MSELCNKTIAAWVLVGITALLAAGAFITAASNRTGDLVSLKNRVAVTEDKLTKRYSIQDEGQNEKIAALEKFETLILSKMVNYQEQINQREDHVEEHIEILNDKVAENKLNLSGLYEKVDNLELRILDALLMFEESQH